MIERYEHILFTKCMQFAYKRYHSTDMCTTMIKEISSYYNSRHTYVFLCTLDASKAFDNVHLGKLFALLHNRGLPPVANCLLLDMYTCQRMCTTWNGVQLKFFDTESCVKQGGIFSTIPQPFFVCTFTAWHRIRFHNEWWTYSMEMSNTTLWQFHNTWS